MSRSSRAPKGSSLSCAANFAIESLELRRLLNGYSLTSQIGAQAPTDSANFGIRVATNGNLALVAAPNANNGDGQVSLVDTTSGSVVRTFNNPSPELANEFGLGITWVGNKIAISAPDSFGRPGEVYVYDDASDPTPTIINSPYAPNPSSPPVFGSTLAAYGNDLLISTTSAPTAGNNGTILRYNLTTNSPVTTYSNPSSTHDDNLGLSMAVDGAHIYASAMVYDGVNAMPEGVVVEFDGATGNVINTIHEPTPADNGHGFGSDIAISGNNLLIDAGGVGVVYQFDKNTLSQIRTYTLPAGETSGGLGAISINGNYAIIGNSGAYNGNETDGFAPTGEAYVFDITTGDYVTTIDNPTPQNPPPDNGQVDTFGSAVGSLPGGKFIVGDPFDDNGAVIDAGSVYVFAPPVVVPSNQPPTAVINGPTSAPENSLVVLDGNSSTDPDGSGDINSYLWDLDNDNQFDDASGPTASFTPDLPGSYTVSLQVIDSAGHTSTASKSITITDVAPTANAGSNQNATTGTSVNFSGSGTSAPGDARTLAWDFDYDNNPAHFGVDASGANVSHTYASPGTYTAALRVTDDDGQVAYSTVTITVTNAPPANSAPANLTISGQNAAVRLQNITLNGSYTDANAGDTQTVSWNFGDGGIIAAHPTTDSGALSVGHAYTATGAYTVTMTIKDSAGASTSKTYNVNVTATGVQGGVLYVGGTAGADTVNITRNGANNTVTVGNTTTNYNGSKVVIYEGAGNDTLLIANNVTLTVEAHGGAGNDVMSGGAGPSILIGDAGNDLLTGGAGRDLLIGGTGADILMGDTDDDILIAGSTSHDNNSADLSNIMAEWTSSRSYAARVANEKAGLLTPDQDVFDDAAADILVGGNGNDWFMFNNDQGVRDLVVDRVSAEQISDLDVVVS